MLKKIILPLAAVAAVATSCDTSTKESYYTVPFQVFNIIVDTHNTSEPAQFSQSVYSLKHIVSNNVLSINQSGMTINGQQVSFETDTMSMRSEVFQLPTPDATPSYGENLIFGGRTLGSSGASLDYFSGKLNWRYWPGTNDTDNPNFEIGTIQNLDLSYMLNDRYSVQTILPYNYYIGTALETDVNGHVTALETLNLMVEVNFMDKKANAYIYNRAKTTEGKLQNPQLVKIKDIPLTITHNGYLLQASAPKTLVRIMGDDGRSELKENPDYQVGDFDYYPLSADLSEARISWTLAGKKYAFQGSSLVSGTPVSKP